MNYGIIIFGLVGMLTIPILFYSANADVTIKAPPNWQASPENNSTNMAWFDNSTKSIFLITKTPTPTGPFAFPLYVMAPIFAQAMAEADLLESTDQTSFGHSNFGYRYILNLTSAVQNLSSVMQNLSSTPIQIPFELADSMKMMVILTQKHGENYAVALLSPTNNFEAVLNEIKPTLDSIKITKSPVNTGIRWSTYNDSALGLSLEYPSGWDLNSTANSMCDPVTGTCFTIALLNESTTTDIKTYSEELQRVLLNSSLRDEMIEPVEMSNYTIDGEPSAEGTWQFAVPETGDVVLQQNIYVIHNGKIYVFTFASYGSEINKSETKEIGYHMIKSTKWAPKN